MFLKGVPSSLIMGITGHVTEKEFLKYIKVDEEQKADMFEKYVKWEQETPVDPQSIEPLQAIESEINN